MNTIDTARLYSTGHDLLNKEIVQLYKKLQMALVGRDHLFLWWDEKTFFLEYSYDQAKYTDFQNFLDYFQTLGISSMILDKKITAGELESFIGILAGAGQGQGEEVASALHREQIKHVQLSFLDSATLSTIQTTAAQISQTNEDEAIWQQLIIQPAAAGSFKLSQEKINQILLRSKNVEELKKILLQLDNNIVERRKGISSAQRGALLGNFLENLGNIFRDFDPDSRERFVQQMYAVVNTLEPKLKTHTLGAEAPDDAKEKDSSVIHEIIRDLPDDQLISLLTDALKESGAKSGSFNNLFNRALAKYGEPAQLLGLIRKQMDQSTHKGNPDHLNRWLHLEQLLIDQQETKESNEKYNEDVVALSTSILMEEPTAEEEELSRLHRTLQPQSLREAKAKMIIDLIRRPSPTRVAIFIPGLFEEAGEILGSLLSQEKFLTVGDLLHEIFLVITEHPMEDSFRQIMASVFAAEDTKKLVKYNLVRCHEYHPRETKTLDAICQLYPEEAGDYLLDVYLDQEDDDSPKAQWLSTTLASISPGLTGILGNRLDGAIEKVLQKLIPLAAMSEDPTLASNVEQFLDHRNHEIRLKVIITLGKLKADQAVKRLGEIVFQKSLLKTKKTKSLQMAAAYALAEIGTDKARAILRQAAKHGSGDIQKLCEKLV